MPAAKVLTKPPCVIVDIDGTLSNASHRQHLVQDGNKDWDRFYDLCEFDDFHPHIGVIVNLLYDFYKIVLVSGRVERVRDKTVKWLDQHKVSYDELFMRPDGDFRPDDVLKAEILGRDIAPKWHPVMAFDDRDRVVAMWRKCGIPCLQVAPGAF